MARTTCKTLSHARRRNTTTLKSQSFAGCEPHNKTARTANNPRTSFLATRGLFCCTQEFSLPVKAPSDTAFRALDPE